MSEPSAFQQFEALLRQIVSLRAGGASAATLEATTEAAWELWNDVPPLPAGEKMQWPSDIAAIASELGFDAIADVAPLDDDSDLELLATRIEQDINAVGGVGNVRVSCSPERIVITGIAGDEEARDEALIVAAKLAPGIQIEDAIDVA